ncbi:MAG: magnesium transporter, partial [Candidatus Heimdallarchaeaceae archaeon]
MLKPRSSFTILASFTLSVFGGIIFNLGGLFAGRTAVLLQKLQEQIVWVFLVYPLLLTVRGDINGILTAKLGSALHLGTIKPYWIKNEKQFYQLIGSIFILTIYDSFLVGIISFVVSLFLPAISISFLDVLIISTTTFTLGAILSMVLTFAITFLLFKRKGDPDVYIYPIMSSVNDILITALFFLICSFYKIWFPLPNLILFVGIPILLIVTIVSFLVLFFWRKEFYVKENLLQALPTVTITSVIAVCTGLVLSSFQVIIDNSPILLICFPAILSTVGSEGSVIANVTTTKLHLGVVHPSFSFFKSQDFTITFSGTLFAGILLNIIIGLIAIGLNPQPITFLGFWLFLIVLLLTNILAFSIIASITISAAFLIYKFGLDPDNMVIPILASIADLVTTSFLVL